MVSMSKIKKIAVDKIQLLLNVKSKWVTWFLSQA